MIEFVASLDPRTLLACAGLAMIGASLSLGVFFWWITP